MARINLLPWRQEVREKRNKDFMTQMIGVGLVSLLLAFLAWTFFNQQLEQQQEANDVVKQANIALDRDLEQIKELEKTRTDIVSRMKVIQDLQGKRPIPVHILDTLVRTMPANMFFTNVNLKGKVLTISGRADNPNSVSDLLRNLDATRWLENSKVNNIEQNTFNNIAARFGAGRQAEANGATFEEGLADKPAETEYVTFTMTTNIADINLIEDKKAVEDDKTPAEPVQGA